MWTDTICAGRTGRRAAALWRLVPVLLPAVLAGCGGTERGPVQARTIARFASSGGQPPVAEQARQIAAAVRSADSLERANRFADAATRWRAAADVAPAFRHWLLLNAAAAQPNARTRERWLADVAIPATADSAAWPRRVEGARLRALLRHGDTTDAVQRYLALGNTRDSVVAFTLRQRRGEQLAAAERLHLARGARRIGDALTARREYAMLARERSSVLTNADRFDYAELLLAGGAATEAAAQFAQVGGAQAGLAAYQRARALVQQGQGAQALTALRRVTTGFGADTNAAGWAWFLLGDLAADRGASAEALSAWRTLTQRYPTHVAAGRAGLLTAMYHVAAGRWIEAERALRAVVARGDSEQLAARYWLGRVHRETGRHEEARQLWRALLAEVPDSYYAQRAAARLDTLPWRRLVMRDVDGPPTGDGATAYAEAQVQEAVDRAAWLDTLGLHDEARNERGDLVRSATRTAGDARRASMALLDAGHASLAMLAATRVASLARSSRPADVALRYPLPYAAPLERYARASALPVALVAALIRQESRFTASARSRAGARGLMQLMPAVGRSLAVSQGIRPWHDSLLYDPEINLRLGTRHLAAALRREGGTDDAHLAYALAAYNAGHTRLQRWRGRPGAARDWELFVEHIPYAETREYVRVVLRNRAVYDALAGRLAR